MKRSIIIFLVITLIITLGIGIGFLSLGYFLSPQSKLTDVDAIVTISGGETQARTAEAIKLYKQGLAKKIIFSGAAEDPHSPSNALMMQQIALNENVPPVDIILEEKSVNTEQNASEVAKIIRAYNFNSIILITSPYHQRRAYLEFKKQLGSNFNILNHSSPDQTWRRSKWWASDQSISLTFQELKKVFYIWWTGN